MAGYARERLFLNKAQTAAVIYWIQRRSWSGCERAAVAFLLISFAAETRQPTAHFCKPSSKGWDRKVEPLAQIEGFRVSADPLAAIERLTAHGDSRVKAAAIELLRLLGDGYAVRLARRDELLRQIATRRFGDLPPTAQAKRLAEALASYAARVWSRTRLEPRCPHPPGLQADLWAVLQLRDAPLSWRQLHRKLLSSPGVEMSTSEGPALAT
jgi:hypothetical protein